MASFIIAILAAFALSSGGRAQMLIGQLSDALSGPDPEAKRRPVPLLAIALVCAAVSASVAAAAAGRGDGLADSSRSLLVVAALTLAALELAWPVRLTPVLEPTRSLVAIGAVLMWRMLTDAARLTLLALAIFLNDPLTIGLGGAIGAMLAATLGWKLGTVRLARVSLPAVRLGLAVATIVAALLIVLNSNYTDL